MSFIIGSLIGAGIGAAAGAGTTAWNIHNNRSEARATDARSYNYWKKQQLRQYELMRQGLERAGFNPLLAIGNGVHSAGGFSAQSGGSSVLPNIAGSAKDMAELGADISKRWKDENDRLNAETDSIRDETARANAEAAARIKNIEADTQLKRDQSVGQKTNNVITPVKEVLNNPLTVGSVSALGGAAANKVYRYLKKKPSVSSVSSVQKYLGVGSKLLGNIGLGLPLLIGSAGALGWEASKRGSGKKLADNPKTSHGNWSR